MVSQTRSQLKSKSDTAPLRNKKDGNIMKVRKTRHPKLVEKEKNRKVQVYNMSSPCRGFCVIFANIQFDHLPKLIGYASDVEALKSVFTCLYFQVKVYRNTTATEMKRKLIKYSQLKVNQNRYTPDAFVGIILTHGTESKLMGKDYNPKNAKNEQESQCLRVEEILEIFDNKNCKLLLKKPKVFFIQACRGVNMDEGVQESHGDADEITPDLMSQESQGEDDDTLYSIPAKSCLPSANGVGQPIEEAPRKLNKLPARSDILVAFGTLPGYVSYVDQNGSTFITELAKALIYHANSMDLKNLMSMVSGSVEKLNIAASGNKFMKQAVNEMYESFTKKLYFNPGYTKVTTEEAQSTRTSSSPILSVPDSGIETGPIEMESDMELNEGELELGNSFVSRNIHSKENVEPIVDLRKGRPGPSGRRQPKITEFYSRTAKLPKSFSSKNSNANSILKPKDLQRYKMKKKPSMQKFVAPKSVTSDEPMPVDVGPNMEPTNQQINTCLIHNAHNCIYPKCITTCCVYHYY